MKTYILSSVIFLMVLRSVTSIDCFVCDATDPSKPFQCSEWFERYDTPDILPQNCSDVHDAKYCIKHIGRFEANGINCYQCTAANTMHCSDMLVALKDSPLKPESCDHVHGAKYCIKSTALDGGIGAKRYCSSKDLGNYCDYVQNIGDVMEYRSCIFTCDTDGCNNAEQLLYMKNFLVIFSIGQIILRIFFS